MRGEDRPLVTIGRPADGTSDTAELEEEASPAVTQPPPSAMRWAALMSVPMLWGSFTPTMKLLLTFKRPPPAIVTNLASHVVGAVMLCLLALIQRPPPHCFGSPGPERRRVLSASLELGIYLFFGQLTQLLGLQGTSATVNAILVQASVVIVPLCDSADVPGSGKASRLAIVATRLLPSLLALGGVIVLTSAPSNEDESTRRAPTSPAAVPRATRARALLGPATAVVSCGPARGPSARRAPEQ